MKDLILKNSKIILGVLIILLSLYIIFNLIFQYKENNLKEEIREQKGKIEILKQESVFWRTKSELFEKESKKYKEIVEKSKQNITTVINNYNEKRDSINSLNDDESIKFLSEKLNQKGNGK